MTFKARPEAKRSTKGKVLESKKTVPPQATRAVAPPKKTKVKESLSFLIEDELDKTTVVLAAKDVTAELQKYAEQLSKIEADDVMPMLDSLRQSFGPQAADQFNQVTTAKIRELIAAIQDGKNAINTEISRMEKMVNGGDPSDMAMGAEPPPPPALGDVPPVADDGQPPPEGGVAPPEGELPPDPNAAPAAAPADDPAMGATGFAGRTRKESARFNKQGRRLTEENAADDSSFKDSLATLSTMSPKCYRNANDILDKIHDLSVGGDVRNKLTKALGHIVTMAASEDVWEDDPQQVADLGMSTHFVDVSSAELIREPDVAAIVKDMASLCHMIKFKHHGDLSEDEIGVPGVPLASPAMPSPLAPPARSAPSPLAAPPRPTPSMLTAGRVFESRRTKNVKRLRESSNPDKMILTVFRNVFRECADVFKAVHGTARAFSIDAVDVISIIREAKTGKVDEEAVPSLMGVPMGVADPNGEGQNPNPALMGQNPPKATAANPIPGQPNKPMTPDDMRQAKQQTDAADKAAGINAKAPIVPPKTMVPVKQVQPGQQQVQSVSPQMQQQQRVNKPKTQKPNPATMPGKVVNNANMRTL